jgi:hypothetical protein
MVDVALIPGGGRILAFMSRGRSAKQDTTARRRLLQAGVTVVETSHAVAATFDELVMDEAPFWAGEALPCGPRRPMSIA